MSRRALKGHHEGMINVKIYNLRFKFKFRIAVLICDDTCLGNKYHDDQCRYDYHNYNIDTQIDLMIDYT